MSTGRMRGFWVGGALAALGACAGEPTAPGTDAACGTSAVALEVGQSARAGTGVASCRLAPTPDAVYALAFVDASAIRSAETGRELAYSDYFLQVGLDAPIQAAAPRRTGAEPSSPPLTDVVAAAPIESPTERDRPWTLNEQFELRDSTSGSYQMARVLRIYDDRYVVAWLEQGDPARLAVFLPRLDSAYAVVRDVAVPLLRSTFVDTVPRSSAAAGQYLILLSDTLGTAIGLAFHAMRADTPLAWMYLKTMTTYPATSLTSLLAHEMTHAWQFLHMHATRSPGAAVPTGASLWAVEGGANTVSYFVLGRHAGIAPDANHDWRAPQATEAAALYARRAQPLAGEFTAGYDNAMGFLRDLVLRRMAAGETLQRALREVSRGAIEGWFGHDGFSVRTGLAARMRARLGAGWEPAHALLDWTLSHAADDRTANPVLQDRASLRIWDIPVGVSGWRELGTLLASQGSSLMTARRHGSPVFLYLRDNGPGLEVHLSAVIYNALPITPLQHTAWAVVRIQ